MLGGGDRGRGTRVFRVRGEGRGWTGPLVAVAVLASRLLRVLGAAVEDGTRLGGEPGDKSLLETHLMKSRFVRFKINI